MSTLPEPEPIDAEVVEETGAPLDVETVDGVAVSEAELTRVRAPSAALAAVGSPAVQAAAAAATGFVAGAATLAIVRRRERTRGGRRAVRRRAESALPILGTRSFLIDVHLLRDDA